MSAPTDRLRLSDPASNRMHQDFPRLSAHQSVGEALEWLRDHPPRTRIIYLYVVDEEGKLCGVVPTRRLLLAVPSTLLNEIMVRDIVTLPADATVLDACEIFIQRRLLALPIVDGVGRIIGVVDVDRYSDVLAALDLRGPAAHLLRPIVRFMHVQSASGVVLLACTLIAIVAANSAWSGAWAEFWSTPIRFGVGGFELNKPLQLWINDGLMTLFFFVAGLEIKRELVVGELRDRRAAMLPIVAAIGGMIAPALLYLAVLFGRPGSGGWGIPMATDIAFVVGFLALLGSRIPHSLKILLLTLAIADDIGAVIVIALAYSHDVHWPALAAGAAGLGFVGLLRSIGVRRVWVYTIVGGAVWLAFLKSGVHPTVAGVALGLLTPTYRLRGERVPLDVVTDLLERVGGLWGERPESSAAESVSPVERLERVLHPWVAFIVMPVFALANSGVALDTASAGSSVAAAVAVGLIIGKPLGIVLFIWAAIRIGLARLPKGVDMRVIVSAGCLAGIGFTMSLFIASLALSGVQLEQAKVGIMAGSTVSAALGCGLLMCFLPRKKVQRPAFE